MKSIHAAESGSGAAGSPACDHQIVVFAVPDDLEAFTRVLLRLPDMDLPTARHIMMSLPGLIPCRLARSEAAEMAAQIRDLGVDATSIPDSDIPEISHALPVHHVKVEESVLEAIDFREESRTWDGSSVDVLSVGVVPSNAPKRHRAAPAVAMGSSHRSWNDGSHLSAKKRLEAYVILDDGQVLQIASDEMNYEYLAKRLSGSSTANFTSLIRDLHELAPQSWVTPSTRAFLDHAPQRHYEFQTHEEFQRYTQFHTLLRGQVARNRR